MSNSTITEALIVAAMLWLFVEGVAGFVRYRRAKQDQWAWWLIANSLAGIMLLLAGLALLSATNFIPMAVCLAGSLVAHLMERRLRPDRLER